MFFSFNLDKLNYVAKKLCDYLFVGGAQGAWSIQVVHGRVGCSSASTRHAAGHALGSGIRAGSLVHTHHDGVVLGFKLLLLLLDVLVGFGIALKELEALVGDVADGLNIHNSEVRLQLILVEG